MYYKNGVFSVSNAVQELLSPVRAAIQRYDMIQPNDRIAVGVSGGKDSVMLLSLLAHLQRFYPHHYTLTAITIDPCFEGKEADYGELTEWCNVQGVSHIIKRTRLADVIFNERRESNPCSLCARMRRGILHKEAVHAGCNVVALGHHQDDAAETFMMNLLNGGTVGSFSPKSYLSRRDLWMIRPLIFVSEKEITAGVRRCSLPVIASHCPVNGNTNRQHTKELLASLSAVYGPINQRLMGALQKSGIDGW
jgi:tRNA(Ile)-lysidine synthetase-like protein